MRILKEKNMEKKTQIPLQLYEMMVSYIHDHYDPSDKQRFMAINHGIQMKKDAKIRRNLYSAYKTESDPVTREMLRTSYLDNAGIPSHGRWSEKTEQLFREGAFED